MLIPFLMRNQIQNLVILLPFSHLRLAQPGKDKSFVKARTELQVLVITISSQDLRQNFTTMSAISPQVSKTSSRQYQNSKNNVLSKKIIQQPQRTVVDKKQFKVQLENSDDLFIIFSIKINGPLLSHLSFDNYQQCQVIASYKSR